MADEFGEKTEPATPRKKQEARQKGNVARSTDLNTAVLLLCAFLLLFFLASRMLQQMSHVVRLSFSGVGEGRITLANVIHYGEAGLTQLVMYMLPILITIFVVGCIVNLLQVGVFVSGQPVSPDVNKINPFRGLKRVFSRRSLMRTVFGVFKLIVIGVVLVNAFSGLITPGADDNLLGLMNADLQNAFDFSTTALTKAGAKAALAMLVLALIDFAYQKWQHEQDLRMSKQEVREELKRLEGDPKVKERRKRVGQQLALQRMMQDVPKADVVITNPTHVSCAIQYDEGAMEAPKLLAKGKGHMAHRIRELAVANDVPIVERPPLARLIYDTTEVGEQIPADLYQPVAEVLAYVYRLKKSTRSRQPQEQGVAS